MRSILDHVLDHAARAPDRLCVHIYSKRTSGRRTFGEVAAGAARAAAGLAARGVRAGDVVVLVGTHHADLPACWLGAVWLGAVPTILAEPSVRVDRGVYWTRLAALLGRIGGTLLVHDPRVKLGSEWPQTLATATYEAIAATPGVPPPRHVPMPGETLLLQHSSGTTGLHKGVMLSHAAVLAHHEAYARVLELNADDVIASWLPLYHDMGFIACFVGGLLAGVPVVWLSPFEWVANPGSLLDAVSEHRATLTWLPNFAFAFLAQRAKDGATPWRLDSLRAVINCSEPVTALAFDAFAARFAASGLRKDALVACYAMAENVFAVTTSTAAQPARRRTIDRAAWQREHVAREASGEGTIAQVSSGRAVPGCEVKIVDAAGATLPAEHAGRILIRSPFLFSGYFRRDDLAAGLFDEGGFYDTGDLGVLDGDGELFVTGRAKDLVIVGGKNVYPDDVEALAGATAGVQPGRAVCFGVTMRELGTEALVLVVEPAADVAEADHAALAERLRVLVPARLDLDLVDVRVVPRASLRKSTSGKLARSGNREWYLEGRFGAPAPGVGGLDSQPSAPAQET